MLDIGRKLHTTHAMGEKVPKQSVFVVCDLHRCLLGQCVVITRSETLTRSQRNSSHETDLMSDADLSPEIMFNWKAVVRHTHPNALLNEWSRLWRT